VAAERRVRPFAVELVGAQHEGAVDGRALGRVGGQGVAVLEPAFVAVAAAETKLCVAGGSEREGSAS
jgi:hypothetical protein